MNRTPRDGQAELFEPPAAPVDRIECEPGLLSACVGLIGSLHGLTRSELQLAQAASPCDPSLMQSLNHQIAQGCDPLGEAFLGARSSQVRRSSGAVYTPDGIVSSMMAWVRSQGPVSRVVDPGAGSGRFLIAGAQAFPSARLVAVELDPLAALVLRANAAVLGLSGRLELHVCDFRDLSLDEISGRTAYVGNPPYVRHHDMPANRKRWYLDRCQDYGVKASALAGLHLHFFVKILNLAKANDIGALITASEWLDVNYGSALRELLVGELGGVEVRVLAPEIEAFPGTATTAAITCFRVGEVEAPIRILSLTDVDQLELPDAAVSVSRTELKVQKRWSSVLRASPPHHPNGMELGELFSVHRGQVTGANAVWVTSAETGDLPERFTLPAVTKARDLIQAGQHLRSAKGLRRVIELPTDLDDLHDDERESVDRFLRWARSHGAHEGYVARHRKAWWSVGLRAPAPLLCTYMGRRPPQFTINGCAARHINVAHGLYPREAVDDKLLEAIARWLNDNTSVGQGRTYSGGLTKFEPREIERLRLPDLKSLLR